MFSDSWLSHEELNVFKRIVIKQMCIMIIAKVVWIGRTIVTHCDGFPRVNVLCIRHFLQPFQYSVGQCEVADGCHHTVPERLVDRRSAQVVLDLPVC